MVGNIVMIPTEEVENSAITFGLVNRKYLLFDVVIDYIYIDWETGRVHEEWDSVVRNHEQPRIQWVKVAGRKYEDWDIVLHLMKWVKVGEKGWMLS